MNYEMKMEEQLKDIKVGSKILLHACCAPCSSAVLEKLANYFEITILYYNPNITIEEEYQKRVEEINKLINIIKSKYKVTLLEGNYEPNRFLDVVKGLEKEPERGKRCYKCYQLRLEETAKIAQELNIPYFCTTLTLSPHKNANWINEIGEELDKHYKTTYLYSDFKKKEGYKRSIELSKQYNLYRQDYCGCIFSIRNKEKE